MIVRQPEQIPYTGRVRLRMWADDDLEGIYQEMFISLPVPLHISHMRMRLALDVRTGGVIGGDLHTARCHMCNVDVDTVVLVRARANGMESFEYFGSLNKLAYWHRVYVDQGHREVGNLNW